MRKIALAFLIILVSVSFGFAASLKVSELTETQTLTDDDLFLVSTYADGSYTSKYIAKSYLKTALGNMTTILNDTLWDAAGDLVYGTGANAGARLAIGAPYALLMTNSGATAPAWTYELGATGTRLTKIWATDLEITNAPTINGAALTTILQPLNDDLTTLSSGGTANCLWGEKSDSSGIECKTTINAQFDDSAAFMKDNADATKTFQLELSGITTSTKRTMTVPNADFTPAGLGLDNTFTGANTLGDGGDDQRIVSRINATNERWSGHTLYFAQCAASMGFGQPAYIQSTGKPGLADADAAATMPAIGLVVVASTDADTPCTVLTHGVITDTDWNWTVGKMIYVADGDAGAVTATLADISDTNDVVQVVGIAVHADSIFVNPSLTTVVLE
jgi:hypothetical protein